MTKEERKNVRNDIWLCGRCANEIDVTPDSYPIDLLYTWKSQAETGNLSLTDSLPRFLPMFRNVIFYWILILQSQKIKSERAPRKGILGKALSCQVTYYYDLLFDYKINWDFSLKSGKTKTGSLLGKICSFSP